MNEVGNFNRASLEEAVREIKAACGDGPVALRGGVVEDPLAEAFPVTDPGVEPLGERVLVQLRTVKKVSAGGIVLVPETKETDQWNTQVAKVIRVGPLSFRNRSTGERWPEGEWVKPGDFVRVPRWGGDRWERPVEGQEEAALFVMFRDHELIGRVTVDPLSMRNYIL